MATQPIAALPRGRLSDTLRQTLGRIPLHFVIVATCLLWSIPTIALIVSSFRDPAAIASSGWWNALFDPTQWTLTNYDNVLNARGMTDAFINSLIITIPSTLFVILISSFAAYAFAWMNFPFRNPIFLIVVALLVVPLQMALIPILRLYTTVTIEGSIPIIGGNVFGVGSFPGLWIAHTAYGLPFAIFLLRNFFGGLPRELFESAHLDGASDLTIFFRIVLPLSVPAMAALAIFQFLWVWQDLLLALVLLNDPQLNPMTVQISSLVNSFGTNYQVLTAAAFISMVVPLGIFFALQRYFVEGILAGSVKG